MKNFGIFLLVSLAYIASVSEAQFSRNEPGYRPGFFQQNPCVSKQTCSKCLQTPNCAWCMKEVRKKPSSRFLTKSNFEGDHFKNVFEQASKKKEKYILGLDRGNPWERNRTLRPIFSALRKFPFPWSPL